MSFFVFLNQWWNLPYLVLLGLVAVFFVLQVIGMVGHDADHDVDADADADVDHDVDADHDVDHDAEHDADGDHEQEADSGGMTAAWHEVLAFFGVGRVPFMVVWWTMFTFTGFSGLFLNRIEYLRHDGHYRSWFFFVGLAIALVIGLVCVRLFSRVAAKLVDTGGKGSTTKNELAGRAGVVASATLDDKFGEVRVRDVSGNEQLVHARLPASEPVLARGATVVLVEYEREGGFFWVTAAPEAAAATRV